MMFSGGVNSFLELVLSNQFYSRVSMITVVAANRLFLAFLTECHDNECSKENKTHFGRLFH
jgi:hypothetical protein